MMIYWSYVVKMKKINVLYVKLGILVLGIILVFTVQQIVCVYVND